MKSIGRCVPGRRNKNCEGLGTVKKSVGWRDSRRPGWSLVRGSNVVLDGVGRISKDQIRRGFRSQKRV